MDINQARRFKPSEGQRSLPKIKYIKFAFRQIVN